MDRSGTVVYGSDDTKYWVNVMKDIMTQAHYIGCIELYPTCMCNKCKHDIDSGIACCYRRTEYCPVSECEEFEPEDEKDGN